MPTFKDQVVLITGATSGIGRAAALAFARAGASVVVSGRREPEGTSVVNEIAATGGRARFVRTDVTDESDVAALVAATLSTFGRLDVAFNNAGMEEEFGALDTKTTDDYRRIMDVNVLGVLLSMKHEIPAMLKTGGGSVVNTSSIAGLVGMSTVPIYVASKHAVIGLTKSAALEYAKQGIRVNTVCPAAIETPMFDRFAGEPGTDKDIRGHLASLHPIGRIGTPGEVADAVLYLCSKEASFITGANLVVDGGFTAQ